MRKVYSIISAMLMITAALAFLASNSTRFSSSGTSRTDGSIEVPKFICVEALIHSKVNKATISWFGQQSHSRNLKVTWYVQPNILDAWTVSVLKNFARQGDAIELSFGPVFFNVLTPKERVQLVNMQMSAFKDLFDHYPTMVESYYVDAYTLDYLSVNYPSVKGGVVFVNHESYADGFKSAGAYYMPYYPSKRNTLTPGVGEDKMDFVALPFLQRDIGNCLVRDSNLFNLDPQDGVQEMEVWRSYFRSLLNAYLNGWDRYGLALYMIDLSYPIFPDTVIAEDLTDLQNEIISANCTNLLDSKFVSEFKSDFSESPKYNWVYSDPLTGSFTNHWSFSPERRFGYVSGRFFEGKSYSHDCEACYYDAVVPYDNSAA